MRYRSPRATLLLPVALVSALALSPTPATTVDAAQNQVFSAPRGQVDNVRFTQTGGGVIEVTYDLRSDDPRAIFSITLEVSDDAGRTWNVRPRSVRGDVGPNVAVGTGKKIVWEAGRDIETLQIDQFRFRVIPVSGAAVPAAPRTGRVTVNSQPSGATVLVDGQRRGITPLTLDLSIGSHEVVVQQLGYLDNRRSVQVAEGANPDVSVTLTTTTTTASVPPAQTPSGGGGGGKGKLIGIVAGAAGAAAAVAIAAGGGGGDGGGGTTTTTTTTPTTTTSATCSFSLSSNSTSVGVNAGTGSFTFTTNPSNCAWSASSNAGFLTVTTPSGTGNGTVAFSFTRNVIANASSPARPGVISVSGGGGSASFTVNQSANTCSYSACIGNCNPPTTSDDVGSGGGSRDIRLTTGASCDWTASSNVNFIRITSASSGTSNAVVSVVVDQTPGVARTGVVTVGGIPITLTQRAGLAK